VVAWTPAFLMRVHHLSPELTGAWLGAAFMFGPLIGLPIHGAVADYLLRRGWKDVHLRYPLIMVCIGSPVGIAAYLVSTPEIAVVLSGAFVLITSFYMSLPLAAVMSITPSLLRGKAAAMIGLIASAGAALGPIVVGLFTDELFGRDEAVGQSIVLNIAILAPIIALLYWMALRPLREFTAD
jgi:MFS family permease